MANLKNNHNRPRLSHFTFCDTDLGKMDFDKYKEFTITRAMERVTLEDMDEITRYYGKQVIIHILTSASRLMPRAIAAAKKQLTDTDFSCFIQQLQAKNYSKF